MSILSRSRARRPRLLSQCANPRCRSGWLHLFRERTTPVLEDGWTCSPECTEVRVQYALQRELESSGQARELHHHRIPLGLLMFDHGWITREALRFALEAQKSHGSGRVGERLIEQQATDEITVTRALAIQWNCPVLSPESGVAPALASVMPRLFVEAFGALPLRIAAAKMLYLGFEENLDPALALAIERITGLRVESGIVPSSVFRAAHMRLLNEKFPRIQLGEAFTELAAAHMLARAIERAQPVASRLVRVHNCIWLRMLLSDEHLPLPPVESIRDVVCSIGPIGSAERHEL